MSIRKWLPLAISSLIAVFPVCGHTQTAAPTAQDVQQLGAMTAELKRIREFYGDFSGSRASEYLVKAVAQYNRTCQAQCLAPCGAMYAQIADEPGVLRVCRAN